MQTAKTLLNKGIGLDALNRSEDAIGVYDDLIVRFGAAVELLLRENVAISLSIKASYWVR